MDIKRYINFKFIAGIALIHFIALMFASSLGSPNQYAFEHNFYYLVLFICSGWLLIYRSMASWDDLKKIIEFIKNHLLHIAIIFVAGVIFQKFPDWDIELGIGHRSIFIHSILLIYLTHLFFIKKPNIYLNNLEICNCIYLGMVIGLTSHLVVDISYMFAISPMMLDAHKGHGWLPILPSPLEIPFMLFMT